MTNYHKVVIKLMGICHLRLNKYWFYRYRWIWVGCMNQMELFFGSAYHISTSSDRKWSAGCWRIANSYETRRWFLFFFNGCYCMRDDDESDIDILLVWRRKMTKNAHEKVLYNVSPDEFRILEDDDIYQMSSQINPTISSSSYRQIYWSTVVESGLITQQVSL